jgi:hypothetical protein
MGNDVPPDATTLDDAAVLVGLAGMQVQLDRDTGSRLLVVRCTFDGGSALPVVSSAPAVGGVARAAFVDCLRNLAVGHRIGLTDYREGVRVRLARFDVNAEDLRLAFTGSHSLVVAVDLNTDTVHRTGGLSFTVADTIADLRPDSTSPYRL